MPIVRIAQSVRGMTPGQLLAVIASDPAFPADVRAWSEMTGNELLELEIGETVTAKIRIR